MKHFIKTAIISSLFIISTQNFANARILGIYGGATKSFNNFDISSASDISAINDDSTIGTELFFGLEKSLFSDLPVSLPFLDIIFDATLALEMFYNDPSSITYTTSSGSQRDSIKTYGNKLIVGVGNKIAKAYGGLGFGFSDIDREASGTTSTATKRNFMSLYGVEFTVAPFIRLRYEYQDLKDKSEITNRVNSTSHNLGLKFIF